MMMKWLKRKFSTVLYVQIWENRLKITDIQTKRVFDEQALLAIQTNSNGQSVIQAVGERAANSSSCDIKIIKPFSHPRTLLSDFVIAEKLLQAAFKIVCDNKLFTPSPSVIMHAMEKLEGGLTSIEVRTLEELAVSAGRVTLLSFKERCYQLIILIIRLSKIKPNGKSSIPADFLHPASMTQITRWSLILGLICIKVTDSRQRGYYPQRPTLLEEYH